MILIHLHRTLTLAIPVYTHTLITTLHYTCYYDKPKIPRFVPHMLTLSMILTLAGYYDQVQWKEENEVWRDEQRQMKDMQKEAEVNACGFTPRILQPGEYTVNA